MRPTTLFMIALALAAIEQPICGQAQFLKSLTNNLKQTLQSRLNGKSNQTANAILDKIDSATRIGSTKSGKTTATGATGTQGMTAGAPAVKGTQAISGSQMAGTTNAGGQTGGLANVFGGSVDTSGLSRVLGAFARTAQENPNDTNQADLVMKSLGRLAGGGGVSAQDSAAAIKSFMTAGGGSGVLYQTITTITSNRGNTRDTNSIWLTASGEGRSEMRIPIPGAITPKFVMIGRANQPTYSIMLDAENRTYSLNIIDTALINSGIDRYQVTRVGNETVAGYPCIHTKLVQTTGSGMFKSTTTMDLWTSTAVPGYATYSRLISLQSSSGGLLGALNKAGAGGFLVRMTAGNGKDVSMTMQLWKAEQKSFPASLFAIPAGYTDDAKTVAQRLLSGSAPVKH
ncbi:MAG TPA: DUF4412 domain-containing protein [Puia sp.]|nr:DUF4412 domain-containing protein [Puia sp.]